MEIVNRIMEFVDANLIFTLIPILLTLYGVELLFKSRFETKKAGNHIRWVMVFYAVINWAIIIISGALYPDEWSMLLAVNEPYSSARRIVFCSSMILPFTLLIPKLSAKWGYLLLVAFGLKMGVYFERFVIVVTHFQRDYQTDLGITEFWGSISFGLAMIIFQGIIMAILILGVFEIMKLSLFRANYDKD